MVYPSRTAAIHARFARSGHPSGQLAVYSLAFRLTPACVTHSARPCVYARVRDARVCVRSTVVFHPTVTVPPGCVIVPVRCVCVSPLAGIAVEQSARLYRGAFPRACHPYPRACVACACVWMRGGIASPLALYSPLEAPYGVRSEVFKGIVSGETS